MRVDSATYATHGLGVAVGLLAMVYAFESYHWYSYMQANPAVGSVSGGGQAFAAVLFVLGTVLAFTSFMTALQRAVGDEN